MIRLHATLDNFWMQTVKLNIDRSHWSRLSVATLKIKSFSIASYKKEYFADGDLECLEMIILVAYMHWHWKISLIVFIHLATSRICQLHSHHTIKFW